MLVVEPMPVGEAVGGKCAGVVDDEVGLPKLASSCGVGRMSMVCMNSAW